MMNVIEVARKVVETKAAHVFRGEPGKYEALPWHKVPEVAQSIEEEAPSPGGWVILDLFTASAIVQIHDGLQKAENRERFAGMGVHAAADLAFRLVERLERKVP